MRILVTGSSGHLGEALVRTLTDRGHDVAGVDLLASPFTAAVGSITDRAFVDAATAGVDAVIHTATLHKPHVVTHSYHDFVDTNVTGTLNLLKAAAAAGVPRFVYTSTTSVYGRALSPSAGAPAAWITEDTPPLPKNVYGVTKLAAEGLCELFHRRRGLPCIVLRTSRFFAEEDDDRSIREAYEDGNVKANEYLHRRADLEDVVRAHLRALERTGEIGFSRYVISATTPFDDGDLRELRRDAPAVVRRLLPAYLDEYRRRGWRMFPSIDRVYVNERARAELGWKPRYDFAHVLELLRAGADPRSRLARQVGSKGYHATGFADGPYPVE